MVEFFNLFGTALGVIMGVMVSFVGFILLVTAPQETKVGTALIFAIIGIVVMAAGVAIVGISL